MNELDALLHNKLVRDLRSDATLWLGYTEEEPRYSLCVVAHNLDNKISSRATIT